LDDADHADRRGVIGVNAAPFRCDPAFAPVRDIHAIFDLVVFALDECLVEGKAVALAVVRVDDRPHVVPGHRSFLRKSEDRGCARAERHLVALCFPAPVTELPCCERNF
jgi:hypothetical protein